MSQNTLVVFSHGKESGPWGQKIQALAEVAKSYGTQVISIDYRESASTNQNSKTDFSFGIIEEIEEYQLYPSEADRRVAQLLSTTLPEHTQLILVGSSMGGYVSTVANERLRADGLFLLAPAFYMDGYSQQNPQPNAKSTWIVHGWNDTVIPYVNSIQFASKHGCELLLLPDDHRLENSLDRLRAHFDAFLKHTSKTSSKQ